MRAHVVIPEVLFNAAIAWRELFAINAVVEGSNMEIVLKQAKPKGTWTASPRGGKAVGEGLTPGEALHALGLKLMSPPSVKRKRALPGKSEKRVAPKTVRVTSDGIELAKVERVVLDYVRRFPGKKAGEIAKAYAGRGLGAIARGDAAREALALLRAAGKVKTKGNTRATTYRAV